MHSQVQSHGTLDRVEDSSCTRIPNPSERAAISGNQWQSMAISGNRWQSVAIGGNQWPSESPTRQSGCAISHQHALRDALPDALSMHSHTSPRLSPRAELRDGRGRATRVGEDK